MQCLFKQQPRGGVFRPPVGAMMEPMTQPDPPSTARNTKANNELLQKGILLVLIGLAVLLAPYFIQSPGMQGIVASSAVVGWFALVLGAAFVVLYVVRRRAAARSGQK